MQVTVRSRSINFLLAAYGAVYTVGTFLVLVWFVVDVWSAASLTDRAMQFLLLLGIACGVWFISIALHNLGVMRGGLRYRSASAVSS